MRRTLLIALAIALPARADELGLKAPPKFRITLWADHTLANDIYTMALDQKGRVVVSEPGYIRRLEDTNGGFFEFLKFRKTFETEIAFRACSAYPYSTFHRGSCDGLAHSRSTFRFFLPRLGRS